MKKLFLLLTLFVLTISVKAQFARPTGIVTIPTPTLWRNPADSSITIYQGSVNLYNTFLMKWDSVKVKGYFTNYKILQYRKLNNHDSLSTLDERKYQSLTDTVTWGLGLSQSGHVTKVDTSSASILSRQRALHEYALISHNQSISTIIGLLDSLNNHYTKAQTNTLLTGKETAIVAYEQTITNGEVTYIVPFILKPTALVIYNQQVLPNSRWAGSGTNTLTLYIDPRTYDYLKIQN